VSVALFHVLAATGLLRGLMQCFCCEIKCVLVRCSNMNAKLRYGNLVNTFFMVIGLVIAVFVTLLWFWPLWATN
jgi:hypothetical protein